MTSRPPQALSGTRKAAILMAIMGEEAASAVFKHLPDKDVQVVTKELADIQGVAPEVAHEILEEYGKLALTQDYLTQGGIDFATRTLVKAFGDENAQYLLKQVVRLQQLRAGQLDSLQQADPQQLAKFLEGEHPQTIALILAHLDGKQASTLLMKLPEAARAESIKRLAQLRQFSPEMAEKVSVVLNRRLQSLGEQSRKTYAGFKSVADVMNRLEGGLAKSILEAIEQEDAKLAINIRNLMFTFEDLVGVSDVHVREWLSSMDKKTLAIALKGASSELKDHIFRAMSSRAVEMLKEDMEALGPVRAKEVAQAQQEAVTLLRKLEAEGKVILKSDGDDEYVV
ncbi:MAG TPA: flagellar motor switch protein FliG [Terriglobales bacterium]|nr:flagellar motor switch protein FliG [Terriglobales bacterium]